MILNTNTNCSQVAPSIVPAVNILDSTAEIPPIKPAPTKAGINGTNILAIDLNTFLNGV